MARVKQSERDKSIQYLREKLKPGDTVNCILRHVSASGMSRHISLFIDGKDGPEPISVPAALAMGEFPKEYHGHMTIKVGGCGMDMGFHLVYNLSRTLFPDGFIPAQAGQTWDRNGADPNERDPDGGYALKHRWL